MDIDFETQTRLLSTITAILIGLTLGFIAYFNRQKNLKKIAKAKAKGKEYKIS